MTKKKKQSLYVNFTTTAGTVHFSHLNTPDVGTFTDKKGREKKLDGKYKVTLSFVKDDPVVAHLNSVITDAGNREFPDGLPANFKSPIKDGDLSDKEQYAGRVYMKLASLNAPTLLDAKNNELPPNVLIMSGDTIRVSGAAKGYDGQMGEGVTLYLDMVKLISKNNGGAGGPSAASLFGEDDGYVGESGSSEPTAQPTAAPVLTGSALDIDDL